MLVLSLIYVLVEEVSDVANYKEKDHRFYYVDGWQRMRTVEIDIKGKYIVTTNDFNNENIEEDNSFFYFSKVCKLTSTHAKNVVVYKPKYHGYVNDCELDFLKGKAAYINDGNLCGAWFTFTKDPSGLLASDEYQITSDEYQKSKNIFSKIIDVIKK